MRRIRGRTDQARCDNGRQPSLQGTYLCRLGPQRLCGAPLLGVLASEAEVSLIATRERKEFVTSKLVDPLGMSVVGGRMATHKKTPIDGTRRGPCAADRG